MVSIEKGGQNFEILYKPKTKKWKLSYSEPLLPCAKHTFNPDSLKFILIFVYWSLHVYFVSSHGEKLGGKDKGRVRKREERERTCM